MHNQPNLPPDGTRVRAMTLENLSDDSPPYEVTGKLTTYMTPLRKAKGKGPACAINGVNVDPDTVRAVKDNEEEDEEEDESNPTFAIQRGVGDKWQGRSGRWFTKNQQGHVVPTHAPGYQEPQPRQPGQPEQPSQPRQAAQQQPQSQSRQGQQAQQSTQQGQAQQPQQQQPAQPNEKQVQQQKQQARQGILGRILGIFGGNKEEPIPAGPDYQEIHQLSLSDRMDHAPARDAFIDKLESDPKRQKHWQQLGQQINADPVQAQQAVQQKLQKLINGCSIYSRVKSPDVMMKILNGGFKNQFQTGESTAAYDPKGRANAELRSMGVPMDTPAEQRPMYGYMSDGQVHPDKETARRYGDFIVKMKPDLRQRSSISMGDSWQGASNNYFAASPTDEMSHNSIHPEALVNVGMDSLDSFEAFNEKHNTYIEAQVHGGIAPTDIESVQFRGEPPPELRQKLEEMNIPWSSY